MYIEFYFHKWAHTFGKLFLSTEEEGIGSTSRDEDAFSSVQKHPPHGINIVVKKMNCFEMRDHTNSNSDGIN